MDFPGECLSLTLRSDLRRSGRHREKLGLLPASGALSAGCFRARVRLKFACRAAASVLREESDREEKLVSPISSLASVIDQLSITIRGERVQLMVV